MEYQKTGVRSSVSVDEKIYYTEPRNDRNIMNSLSTLSIGKERHVLQDLIFDFQIRLELLKCRFQISPSNAMSVICFQTIGADG